MSNEKLTWIDVDYCGLIGPETINIVSALSEKDDYTTDLDPMAGHAIIYKKVEPLVEDRLFVLRWSVGQPIDYETTDLQMVKNAVNTMIKMEQSG